MQIILKARIHKSAFLEISYLQDKGDAFVAWLGPKLKPVYSNEGNYVYQEGDEAQEIFFLSRGIAGLVLPRYKNVVYVTIESGDSFGDIDFVPEVDGDAF